MVDNVMKLPIFRTESRIAPTMAEFRRPWFPMENLRREFDRIFADFEGDLWNAPTRRPAYDYMPGGKYPAYANVLAADFFEKDDGFEIRAELPGVDEKDIEVKLVHGGLLIKGEKKARSEEKKVDYVVSERTYGWFERYFELPQDVATDKIVATFTKGILTVMLPKTQHAKLQDRKIEVKAA
jgi:HSP20 family protein